MNVGQLCRAAGTSSPMIRALRHRNQLPFDDPTNKIYGTEHVIALRLASVLSAAGVKRDTGAAIVRGSKVVIDAISRGEDVRWFWVDRDMWNTDNVVGCGYSFDANCPVSTEYLRVAVNVARIIEATRRAVPPIRPAASE